MMFYTIQTKYFLKAGDTHYPVTHCPLTHHPHRPTIPTKSTHSPPHMTIYQMYDVLDHTNHIFSESSWHPLSSNLMPTHPSPTQTKHTHKPTHNPPFMTISPLYDVLHYTNHIFSESWWHLLSNDSLPTQQSPTQTLPYPQNSPTTHLIWPFFHTIQTKYAHVVYFSISQWPLTHLLLKADILSLAQLYKV